MATYFVITGVLQANLASALIAQAGVGYRPIHFEFLAAAAGGSWTIIFERFQSP